MQTEVSHTAHDISLFSQAAKVAVTDFKTRFSTSENVTPQMALALVQLAALYQTIGDHKHAGTLFQKALQIFEREYGSGIRDHNNELHFLSARSYCFNGHFIPAPATLTALDVTEEILCSAKANPNQRYFQSLITWKEPFSGLNASIFVHIGLSMIFHQEGLRRFSDLIRLPVEKEHSDISIVEFVEKVRYWKQVFSTSVWIEKPQWLEKGNNGVASEPGEKMKQNGNSLSTYSTSDFTIKNHLQHATSPVGGEKKPDKKESDIRQPHIQTREETNMSIITTVSAEYSSKRVIGTQNVFKNYNRESESQTKNSTKKETQVSAVEELADLVSNKLTNGKLLDLKELITVRHRKLFVKKLFRKQENQFEKFISRLNQIAEWKSASDFMEEYFHSKGIYHYDKYAIELSDLVYQRYFPSETEVKTKMKIWK